MSGRVSIALAGALAVCLAAWYFAGQRAVPPDPAAPRTADAPPATESPVMDTPGMLPAGETTPPLSPALFAATPVSPAEGGAWNTYHGDAALRGAAAMAFSPPLALRWRHLTGAPVYATPVADGGRIHFVTAKGEVAALGLDGQLLWSRQLVYVNQDGGEMPDRTDAPLACFGGKVFAGTARGMLYALDASNGQELWRADTGAPILGAPDCLLAPDGSGRVYVLGQSDAVLRCYNAADGAALFASEPIDRCDANPAIAPGLAAFGSCAAALHLVSSETGALLHSIPIDEDSQVAGGAAIAEGTVYVGCRSGKVLAADPAAGVFRWTAELCDLEVFATPAVSGDWLAVSAYDGFVYGLDRNTGGIRWRFETGGEPSSPVIAGRGVLAASGGTLFLLRLEDGAELWKEKVAGAISSPALAYGMVVLGVEDGAVAAYGPATPTPSPASPSIP